jgi:hypothetical protein
VHSARSGVKLDHEGLPTILLSTSAVLAEVGMCEQSGHAWNYLSCCYMICDFPLRKVSRFLFIPPRAEDHPFAIPLSTPPKARMLGQSTTAPTHLSTPPKISPPLSAFPSPAIRIKPNIEFTLFYLATRGNAK